MPNYPIILLLLSRSLSITYDLLLLDTKFMQSANTSDSFPEMNGNQYTAKRLLQSRQARKKSKRYSGILSRSVRDQLCASRASAQSNQILSIKSIYANDAADQCEKQSQPSVDKNTERPPTHPTAEQDANQLEVGCLYLNTPLENSGLLYLHCATTTCSVPRDDPRDLPSTDRQDVTSSK
jgi:hypothetical protein